jgi:hypothetical protein
LEDTKVVIRICKSKDRQHNGKKTSKTMIYKTLHRKLVIKHHEPHKNQGRAQMLWKGKKSFKIPKGFSENLNGRTDNTFI